jgi:hypothetical protein
METKNDRNWERGGGSKKIAKERENRNIKRGKNSNQHVHSQQ